MKGTIRLVHILEDKGYTIKKSRVPNGLSIRIFDYVPCTLQVLKRLWPFLNAEGTGYIIKYSYGQAVWYPRLLDCVPLVYPMPMIRSMSKPCTIRDTNEYLWHRHRHDCLIHVTSTWLLDTNEYIVPWSNHCVPWSNHFVHLRWWCKRRDIRRFSQHVRRCNNSRIQRKVATSADDFQHRNMSN
jgi:hypothetical protein